MNNKDVNLPKVRGVEQNPGKEKTKDDIKPTAMDSHEVIYENLDADFQKSSYKTFTVLNCCITGDISCNEMRIHENDLRGKKIIQDTNIDTKLSIVCPEAELYFIPIETSSDPQKGKNELLCKEKSKIDLKSNTSSSSISKPHRMMLNKTFLYPNRSFNSNRHPTPKAFTSSLQRSFTKANNIVRAKNVLEELKEEDCDDDDFYSKGNLKNLLT
ncbi:unnamed protein product [Moneuplotes crassus]|uniref:Uncharacterized protein n=1 Tax=Euplotes crassus TaxID=5936 RepID=A0AAD1U0G6_EUPCR|nr:unnamed protein product [Moneuplotes crassus]